MPTIGNSYLDLMDVYKTRDSKGRIIAVIEMLRKLSPVLKDAIAVECNNGTYHEHAVRTGLPTPVWGRMYKGTPQSKSQKEQVTDVTGFLESMSSVDERVMEIAGEAGAAMRLQEAQAHLEAIAQAIDKYLTYFGIAPDA